MASTLLDFAISESSNSDMGFKLGAALEDSTGRTYTGANVETPTGNSLHAEMDALSKCLNHHGLLTIVRWTLLLIDRYERGCEEGQCKLSCPQQGYQAKVGYSAEASHAKVANQFKGGKAFKVDVSKKAFPFEVAFPKVAEAY